MLAEVGREAVGLLGQSASVVRLCRGGRSCRCRFGCCRGLRLLKSLVVAEMQAFWVDPPNRTFEPAVIKTSTASSSASASVR